jgi:hypothetical protein
MEIIKYLLLFFLGVLAVYIFMRVSSYAVLKSFFQIKSQQEKEKENGEE